MPHDHIHWRVVWPGVAVPRPHHARVTSLYNATADRGGGFLGPDLLKQMGILIERK